MLSEYFSCFNKKILISYANTAAPAQTANHFYLTLSSEHFIRSLIWSCTVYMMTFYQKPSRIRGETLWYEENTLVMFRLWWINGLQVRHHTFYSSHHQVHHGYRASIVSILVYSIYTLLIMGHNDTGICTHTMSSIDTVDTSLIRTIALVDPVSNLQRRSVNSHT